MKLIPVSENTKRIINDSPYSEKVQQILDQALKEMEVIDASPDETQVEVLTNHLAEMVNRSETGETLEEVDIEMFHSLSQDSLDAADRVAKRIGNLNEQEKYILAVHFEVAKN
ncbi:PRD domain-containing protein [Companilactobacillus keshanensis]|uniref:PRD domain-containing protein n=1 Tax=Companilactobacillus keshanensis TaxID=2486003 RepID=A0ABW4BVM1_9LACO|nr:PRD domain-containing protein [Companilactobacillus keshanensis]